MPASYQIHVDKRLIIVSYSGSLSLEDIAKLRQQSQQDPEYDTTYNVIDDVTAVDSSDISFDELSDASSKSVQKTGVKRALIAVTPFQRGMANMYRVLSEAHGHVFRIYDNRASATKWMTNDKPSA